MAFATALVKTCNFGPLKVTFGDWTGSQADAAGSIGVAGGRVYLTQFSGNTSSGEYTPKTETSYSTSGNISTVTVYNSADVTAGTFLIIHS